MEYIEQDEEDIWHCLCGNSTCWDGFYPCDLNGNEVEPTPELWTTDLYICPDCGRIFQQSDGKVVGMRITPFADKDEP